MLRYRFSDFTLSPQRRLLLRDGREVPIIPRYFDLLLLLVARRHEAVHRREIFDSVWADGIVSDSALSQAIRTIRRTLGDDDPREPRFIRTVSRHGYQFVFPDVIEEADDVQATRITNDEHEHTDQLLPRSLRHAGRLASRGAAGAALGGSIAGVVAGAVGGLLLAAAPDSFAPLGLAPVLAVIGGGCGAIGGAGVGATMVLAEAVAPTKRVVAMAIAGAVGGGLVGAAVQWLTRWALAALVGLDLPVGGGLEGILIGAAAGLGFALATPGTATGPRPRHLQVALVTAAWCGLAGVALSIAGRPLAGGTIHVIADAADGSRATLAPLGRLIGEPDFGPTSSGILAFGEAATFGAGLALGLMRRRRDSRLPDSPDF